MHLERWALDEVAALTATLLRSVCRQVLDSADAAYLASRAPDLENALISDDDWSEEEDWVLARDKLADFLTSAAQTLLSVEAATGVARPLPREPRPLAEGDVYWLLLAQPPDLVGSQFGPKYTEYIVETYRWFLQHHASARGALSPGVP